MDLNTDVYIKIVGKNGGCFEIHELQIGEMNIYKLHAILIELKQSGSFYQSETLYIDTGQIAFMMLDDRSYLK